MQSPANANQPANVPGAQAANQPANQPGFQATNPANIPGAQDAVQQQLMMYNQAPKKRKQPQPKQPEDKGDLKPGDADIPVLEDSASQFFSKFSVQGGLAIAFVILIAAIWMLIPTQSGYTRMQLLWFTIIGKTELTTSPNYQSNKTGETAPVVPSNNQIQPLNNGAQPLPSIPTSPNQGSNNIVPLSGIDFESFGYGEL